MPGLTTVVDTLAKPDQPHVTDASRRRRTWTLVVACAGVALVIASMIALNAALGDIAVATSATQTQLTWVVDGYTLALACLLLPAGADRRPLRPSQRAAHRPGHLHAGLAGADLVRRPGRPDRVASGGRCRRRVRDACDAVVAHCRLSKRPAHQGRWHLGRCRRVCRGGGFARPRCAAARMGAGSRSSGCSRRRGSCCSR